MIPMTDEEAYQAGRKDPQMLKEGERIAIEWRESWLWVRWEDGLELPRSQIDGKRIIVTVGWEVDDNG